METIIIYFVSGLVIGWIIKRVARNAARKEAEKWQSIKADVLKEAIKEHEEFERWKRSRSN